MAITIRKLDGTTETIEATPGITCKQAMIDKGIYAGPEDSFQVHCGEQNVDLEPLENFDNEKLIITPVKKEGGNS